ncbi:MAG: response regulator transcription factor [Pseudomonadota bacterium]
MRGRDAREGDAGAASVLVVEDSLEVARHFARAIEGAPRLSLAGLAHSVDGAMHLLYGRRPRIALVDLGLPDGSGLEVIRAAQTASWRCESIVISIFGDDRHVLSAIEAGAIGYLQKTSETDDVARAIEVALAGGSPMSPRIARRVLARLAREQPSKTAQGGDDRLTQREREVLELVAEGLQRREIAGALGIALGTVGNHIHNIYRKLQVRSNTEAVSKAQRGGLL